MTNVVVGVVRSIRFHISLYFVCRCYLCSVDFRKEFLRTGGGWTRLKFNPQNLMWGLLNLLFLLSQN
jgi:hypothetical protein